MWDGGSGGIGLVVDGDIRLNVKPLGAVREENRDGDRNEDPPQP